MTFTPQEDWALVCIVRQDMDTMTPGRVAAQVSHAASLLASYMFRKNDEYFRTTYGDEMSGSEYVEVHGHLQEWHASAGGYGTAIILQTPSLEVIRDVVRHESWQGQQDVVVRSEPRAFSGMVIDPEYGVRDGKVTHLVPNVPTVGWLFIDRKSQWYQENIRSHPEIRMY